MYPGNILLVKVILLFLITVISEMYYDWKRLSLGGFIGEKKYTRVKKATIRGIKQNVLHDPEQVFGNNLYMGDIILLKKYDISPADCIILGSTDTVDSEYVCHIDNSLCNGIIQRDQKWAVRLTRTFCHLINSPDTTNMFLRRLSGKV